MPPRPLSLLGGGILRPWTDREPGRKKLAPTRATLEIRVARGEPCRSAGKLGRRGDCSEHQAGSTSSEALLRLGVELLRWLPGQGWSELLSPDSGHRTSPRSPQAPFLVGAQSRCGLTRRARFPAGEGGEPPFFAWWRFFFLIKRQNTK